MSADREFVAESAKPTAVTVPPHIEDAHVNCANCAVRLSGHYCSNCGQKGAHPELSLRHFLAEVTEDLTHADSRLWQTLGALISKPGYLTAEFLAGRRTRYLPPVRLYLVTSVLFFLLAAISNNPSNPQRTAADVAKTNAEVARAQAAYHKATGRELLIIGTDPNAAGVTRQERLANCTKVEEQARKSGRLAAATLTVIHKACVSSAEDNGQALGEAFLHNLPKALFVTLPVMAALMKLLYWRPRRYYVEHLLFLVHNYAFTFLWFAVIILLGWIVTSDNISTLLGTFLGLYLPYYYFRGMRRLYPEGVGRTLGKFTVLSVGYLVVAVLAMVATGIYSVLVQ